MTPTTARAVTFLVLAASGAGSILVIAVPQQPRVGWWIVLCGLVVSAVMAKLATATLLANPPATRSSRQWLGRVHQITAVLLIGLGIRGVDGWWNTPGMDRPPAWLAFCGLAALGYLSVRLGMTATFLRPSAPQAPAPPA
jgi:hypothetical protein